jgi:hypothetical protein
MNLAAEEFAAVEVPVDDLAYARLKLLACAIETAFRNGDFQEAQSLLADRGTILDRLGPNARLTPAQAKDLGEIESRIGWQVHQSRATLGAQFRRLAQTRGFVRAYAPTATAPRFDRAG